MQRSLSLAIVLSLMGHPAQACRLTTNLTPDEVSQADSIFIGRVVGLTPAKGTTRGARDQVTTVTLEVERVVRGRRVEGTIKVYGYDSTVESFPRSMTELVDDYGPVVEVAVVFPDTIKSKTACHATDWVNQSGQPKTSLQCKIDLPVAIPFDTNAWMPLEHPTIIGKGCTGPYIRSVEEQPAMLPLGAAKRSASPN